MSAPIFVPVCRKDIVVDYAWVDAEDFAQVSDYRWSRIWPHAYAGRRLSPGLPALRGISMHRFLMGLARGDEGVVHHVNEDPLDNRRSNLKLVADKMAHGNEPHPRRDAKCSPYRPKLPPHQREVALASLGMAA